MGISVTDTTLRDAHQSLIATRMRTKDMLSIAEKLDKVGFFSLEAWGGATFDTCIRYLNEDPWDRVREIKKRLKNTRLQMLLRGQNLVGYRHYPDDVVREFIRLAVKNGVDVFRIFDALNDIANMELSIKVAKDYGAHVQGAISYTVSPVHTVEGFADMAGRLEGLGCDSICIKDMAGLITPKAATDLVKALKGRLKVPVNLHSHCSSGMAPISYYAAAEAGVDILDTAFSSFAWGTSQPPTESMAAAFQGTPYDTGLDLAVLNDIGEEVAELCTKYRVLFTAETTRANISVLLHQIPGGMLSNLVSQLREQKALDRLNEVLEEVPRVREDLGYPPLVTPTSQVVGIQAVLNVLSGERYKKVTQEVKSYLLGQYGRPPGKVNEKIRKMVIGDERPIDVRPADLIEPELDKLRYDGKELGIIKSEEDVITYALYPQVAIKFLRGETKEEAMPSLVPARKEGARDQLAMPVEFKVDVDGEVFNIKVMSLSNGEGGTSAGPSGAEVPPGAVTAPMPGMIVTVKVKEGDFIEEGAVVAILEAMKMQNEIHAPRGGVIRDIRVRSGAMVGGGDVLMVVADGQ